jgi:hypothetical protein
MLSLHDSRASRLRSVERVSVLRLRLSAGRIDFRDDSLLDASDRQICATNGLQHSIAEHDVMRDVSGLPLIERKALLEPLVAGKPGLQFNSQPCGRNQGCIIATAISR